ncbi:hypothetical protein RND81_06G095300 [Saponaria officinalis]|uniref:Uncharacterized protein n=1 Tax=Saponaria officinalis TaxID=3572 RepID=A0AAW1K995_SAPOF
MRSNQNSEVNFPRNGFYTPPPISKSINSLASKSWMSEKKLSSRRSSPSNRDFFNVFHKVPHGDSPYVKAKHVQMVEKDPGKAVSLFWNAINSGDRVDSALKDMAAVMKQLNRPDEAIEAIRSFRYLCPADSQESIDNVLVELYKSGRLEEEIEVLLLKLKRVEEMNSSGGKSIRMGRSHGKRVPVRPQQEYARLLGNLAWAYLQLNDYRTAEEYYRKALSIEPDRNKQCNLAVCLMLTNCISEAKLLLQSIQVSAQAGKMDDSYAKSYERASELLVELESQSTPSFSIDNEENQCSNAGSSFTFSPYKTIHDSSTWKTVRGTPPIPGRRFLRSPLTQPRRDSSSRILDGKILVSPFTQPRPDSKLSETDDNWRKGTQRRLQFENPSASDFRPPTDLKRSMNLSEANPRENKGKKSWADIVEEEDEHWKIDGLTGASRVGDLFRSFTP